MGEYAQPVLGMKSCHDFTETDGLDKESQLSTVSILKKGFHKMPRTLYAILFSSNGPVIYSLLRSGAPASGS